MRADAIGRHYLSVPCRYIDSSCLEMKAGNNAMMGSRCLKPVCALGRDVGSSFIIC